MVHDRCGVWPLWCMAAVVYGPVTRRCLSKVGPLKLDVRTE
jgi:hypothetical protein